VASDGGMKPGKIPCFAWGKDRTRRRAALLCVSTYCRFERAKEAFRAIVEQAEAQCRVAVAGCRRGCQDARGSCGY
jgi:hypothetical protein